MWDKIKEAVNLILLGDVKRVDGKGWTAYAVGSNVIRIDLKVEEMLDPKVKRVTIVEDGEDYTLKGYDA